MRFSFHNLAFHNLNSYRLQWLVAMIVAVHAGIAFALVVGEPKTLAEIDWLDVLGEGGATVFAFAWFWFFLTSRPAGQVTRYLSLGLAFIALALFQDALDEFVRFPTAFLWNTLLQSSLLPLGMTLLTVGIYLLRKEQQVISKQLAGRESRLRDHRLVDDLTRIYDVRYLHQHLHAQMQQPAVFSLVLLDVDHFNQINRRFGYAEGDRLLTALVELLLLNMRSEDLLCRYAGDRFAILLSATGETDAECMANQLKACVANFNFYTRLQEHVPVSVAAGVATCRDGDIQKLMEEATRSLLLKKQENQQTLYAA